MIEAQGLGLVAGTRTLVDALDLRLQRGQVWALVGANGSGKTTLLHTLAGLRAPDDGAVQLEGRPYAGWPAGEAACLRGLLPQAVVDSFAASVLDLVLIGRHPHLARWAWEGDDDRRIARAALAAVDLTDFDERDVLTLSGGERQRVAIAALLAQDPLALLMDEPLAHLDLHHQLLVLRHLQALAVQQQRLVVLSVHDLNLAARFATHVLVLGPRGHHAGPVAEVMTEAVLSAAFGHALQRVNLGGQWLFVPA
ncbi:MAG: ABC transporter ATP-binding protein [Burkholderiaceae bacterium]|nr:ABC transporter ATP-binding protein [Rhodoferax sp.]MCP5283447.1 ABC transporter ATP-binding protein [Burkholderiaceae bacterium]